jgi:mannose/fructose-specific phosphotransferase system component IIA
MLHALILTHGHMGQALLESASRILADAPPVEVLSNDELCGTELSTRVRDWADSHAGSVFVFVDVGGGSCGTAAQLALRDRADSWILGGVNLPMVLTYLAGADHLEAAEMASKLLDRALNSVRLLGDESGG